MTFVQTDQPDMTMDNMIDNVQAAADMLKTLGHAGRLQILCHLVSGEKNVTELESLLNERQATVSQHLSRLRSDGLVKGRRAGTTIFYSLDDEHAHRILTTLHDIYCAEPT